MQERGASRSAMMTIIILAGVVLAAANVGAFLMTIERSGGRVEVLSLAERYRLCPSCLVYLTIAPIIFTILLAVLVGRRSGSGSGVATAAEASAAPGTASSAPALRLLAVLQQEARLLDFVEEDIDTYGDAQIGAAVRSIHAGCRKALHERLHLERILTGEDGSPVVVEQGFDAATIRLTGNVAGTPPFRGTLRHGGWRATNIALPESPGGLDSSIIAPAEVEIS